MLSFWAWVSFSPPSLPLLALALRPPPPGPSCSSPLLPLRPLPLDPSRAFLLLLPALELLETGLELAEDEGGSDSEADALHLAHVDVRR